MPLKPLHILYPGCHVWLDPKNGISVLDTTRTPEENVAVPVGGHFAIHARHFTLIPADYYEEESRASYLINLGMLPDTPCTHTYLPMADGYLVYSLEALPIELKSRRNIHTVWEPLFHLAQQDAESSRLLHAHITPRQLYLVAVDAGKIVYFNTFPVQEPMDCLYFVLRAIEDWGQRTQSLTVRLSGHILEGSPMHNLLNQYLGDLSVWSGEVATLSLAEDQPAHQFADLSSFAACVSSVER